MNKIAERDLKRILRLIKKARASLRFELDEAMLFFTEAEREELEAVYDLLNEAAGTMPVTDK